MREHRPGAYKDLLDEISFAGEEALDRSDGVLDDPAAPAWARDRSGPLSVYVRADRDLDDEDDDAPTCLAEGCNGILDHGTVHGNDDLPWVERCDTCERYEDDLAAARAHAALTGGTFYVNPASSPDAPIGTPWVAVLEPEQPAPPRDAESWWDGLDHQQRLEALHDVEVRLGELAYGWFDEEIDESYAGLTRHDACTRQDIEEAWTDHRDRNRPEGSDAG
jgi:hypothetical protein